MNDKNKAFMREFIDLLKKHHASLEVVDDKIVIKFEEQIGDSDDLKEVPERNMVVNNIIDSSILIWGGYSQK